MRSRLARISLVAGAAGALLAGVATPAHAGDNNTGRNVLEYVDVLGMAAGSGSFQHIGDSFTVCKSDRWDVYIEFEYIRINGTLQRGTHKVTGPAPSCATYLHDFGEERFIDMRVCADVDNFWDPCSPWRQGIV
ncbi:hypothetical protein GCM10009827_108240 [Dactylosporangium maewongense]|uniref:Secreted protein n=2 Tax=Micromonosporaceae TaxID=28056 RepID=A0ABP4NVS7_9ACTN